ncbi:uncharacterized protein LOC143070845 [Mytilus galloprovincialis]|uniref:uncharacterized protein LOC143070845 n=1 Tax=Mytilus galloprovincialis TaxID=29158 RepID=UPI003F7C139D
MTQRSCDEQIGFICQLVSGRRTTYTITDASTPTDAATTDASTTTDTSPTTDTITTIDEKVTVTVSSTLDGNTTTELFTPSSKMSTNDALTGLTTQNRNNNMTTYSLQERQYHLEKDALQFAQQINVQCSVDGMDNMTKAVAGICTNYLKVIDFTVFLNVLLKILDSALENNIDSSLHKCLVRALFLIFLQIKHGLESIKGVQSINRGKIELLFDIKD